MFRSGGVASSHEPHEQRPCKSEPKRVWLDAIMSKARQSDTSPFASAASTPSSTSGASYAPRMNAPAPAPPAAAAVQGMYAPNGAPLPSAPAPQGGLQHHHPHQQQRYHHHQRQQQLPPQYEHWDSAPDVPGAYTVSDSVRSRAPAPVVYDEPVREYYGAPQQLSHHSAVPLGPSGSSSGSDMYREQLELNDAVLSEMMVLALTAMVGAQDCCFIAKGICHLCGSSERHLIPVVNFCPAFHVNHSLCREHLRNTYRVRMEDIFAGKNRPTVSKRSLKCAVCSRMCLCSTCQLEKQREISKYRRWLAAEHDAFELSRDDHAVPMDSSHSRPHDRDVLDTTSSTGGGRAHVAPTMQHQQQHHGETHHHHYPVDALSSDSTRADLARDDELRLHPALHASAKPLSHPYRGAKRAAKETAASAADGSPLTSRVPLESPSAAHVLNCAESEKSLVRLLTTLNQDAVSPPAVAEPKGPGSQPSGPPPASSTGVTQPSPHNGPSHESADLSTDAHEDARDGASSRHGKRKRDDSAPGDSESSSEASMHSRRGGPHSTTSADDAEQTTVRKKLSTQKRSASSSDSVPKPSPTARAASKAKAKDARPRSVPKASPSSTSGRKRGGDTPVASADKRSPMPRKGAKANAPPPAAKSTRGKRASSVQDDDDDDDVDDNDGLSVDNSDNESEIDTNLDYCEVCFAAGDLVCCDVCPRSFHLACLKLRESDLPEGDWQCAECRKPSFFVRFRALVHMKQSLYGKCVEAVRCLKSHPFAKQFLTPVKNIEHYTRVVKQPMDLTTIETKLKAGKYNKAPATGASEASQQSPAAAQSDKTIDIDAFAHDVRLVWSNCKLFNDDGSGITRAADELALGFEAIYDDMQQYARSVGKPESKSRSAKSASTRSDASDGTSAPASKVAQSSVGGSTSETAAATEGALEKSSTVSTESSTDSNGAPADDSATPAPRKQDSDASTARSSTSAPDASSAKSRASEESPSSTVSEAAPSVGGSISSASVVSDK